MTNKEKAIQSWMTRPIQVGDHVEVIGLSTRNPESTEIKKVTMVDENFIYIDEYGYGKFHPVERAKVKPWPASCGANPFTKELRMQGQQIDVDQLLARIGWWADWRKPVEYRPDRGTGRMPVPEGCLNPIVFDEDGNEVEYQRGLVWTLEQKQLLIESMYNWVDIGKFIVRRRPFDWVAARVKADKMEHTAFMDLVDGKQRFTALLSFIKGEFADMHGNVWDDLSDKSKRDFLHYRNASYIEMGEDTTDEDVIRAFMAVNHTGVPMSREHLEFVKSIKLK